MVNCCVPHCKSDKNKTKGTGISYHEFPSDEATRREWLRRISRQDFVINGNSNSSAVCSLHFQSSDYFEGYKIRRLKKGSVPSIFSGYPAHKLQKVPVIRRQLVKAPPSISQSKRQKTSHDSYTSPRLPTICDSELEASITEHDVDCTDGSINNESRHQSKYVQTSENLPSELLKARCEKNCYRVKLWRSNKKVKELQESLDKNLLELQKYKKNEYHEAIDYIIQNAEKDSENILPNFLLEQVMNFKKKVPRYSLETTRLCVLWQHTSPKGYNFTRRENILKLPSKSTLLRFVGETSSETGVTDLIIERLKVEAALLKPHELFASLIIDEMDIKPQLQYDKTLDRFFGEKDTGEHVKNFEMKEKSSVQQTSDHPVPVTHETPKDRSCSTPKPVLANKLLCFVLAGLSFRFKIPCAFFFSKQLSGLELFKLTKSVLKEIEKCGFIIIRITTDNLSVNTNMMKRFCGGPLKANTSHPFDNNRQIFLSFDQNHLIKKLWTLLLEKNMTDGNEDINGRFVAQLYEIKVNDKSGINFIRVLSRKHIRPSNFEKMNVARAVHFFSRPVIATLKYMKDHQNRHDQGTYFADAGDGFGKIKNKCLI